jgi:hypothetical protein
VSYHQKPPLSSSPLPSLPNPKDPHHLLHPSIRLSISLSYGRFYGIKSTYRTQTEIQNKEAILMLRLGWSSSPSATAAPIERIKCCIGFVLGNVWSLLQVGEALDLRG